MSLHADLLRQAHHLVTKEPRRPSQASLRRGISTAYYALFHLLIAEASQRLVKGPDRNELRLCLGRAYAHAEMKTVALQFAKNQVASRLAVALRGQTLSNDLIELAKIFVELQQARHEADYDLARRFTRREALRMVRFAESAFTHWRAIRGTVQADTFLLGLLIQAKMRG